MTALCLLADTVCVDGFMELATACLRTVCGFGCVRWFKCGDGIYLFTVWRVLVFLETQMVEAP